MKWEKTVILLCIFMMSLCMASCNKSSDQYENTIQQKTENDYDEVAVTEEAESYFKEIIQIMEDSEDGFPEVNYNEIEKLNKKYPQNIAAECFVHMGKTINFFHTMNEFTEENDLNEFVKLHGSEIIDEVEAINNGYDGVYSYLIDDFIEAVGDTKKLREQFNAEINDYEKNQPKQTNTANRIKLTPPNEDSVWNSELIEGLINRDRISSEYAYNYLVGKYGEDNVDRNDSGNLFIYNIDISGIKYDVVKFLFNANGILYWIYCDLDENPDFTIKDVKQSKKEIENVLGCETELLTGSSDEDITYIWNLDDTVSYLDQTQVWLSGSDYGMGWIDGSLQVKNTVLQDEEKIYSEEEISEQEAEEKLHYPSCSVAGLYASASYTDGSKHVMGTLKNNSDSTVYFVKVKLQYLDKDGNVVDTDSTYAVGDEGLVPGESSKFEAYSSTAYKGLKIEIYDWDN